MKRALAAAVAVVTMTAFTLACGQKGACAEELAGPRSTRRRTEQAQSRTATTKKKRKLSSGREVADCDEDDWEEGDSDCAGCSGPGRDRD